MGIYVFGRAMLSQVLEEDSRRRDSSHDFGKDIIPRMVTGGMRVFAYPFQGYWVDVGTVEAYWQTQMDLLKTPPPVDLNDRAWIVHTRSEERPPVLIQKGATVKDSLITDGCVVSAGARVEKSILSPGVFVGPDAVIRESVILTDTWVDAGARIERAIVDKGVRIGRKARIGKSGPGREADRGPRHHDDRQERGDPRRGHRPPRHRHPHRRDRRALHARRQAQARRGQAQGSGRQVVGAGLGPPGPLVAALNALSRNPQNRGQPCTFGAGVNRVFLAAPVLNSRAIASIRRRSEGFRLCSFSSRSAPLSSVDSSLPK